MAELSECVWKSQYSIFSLRQLKSILQRINSYLEAAKPNTNFYVTNLAELQEAEDETIHRIMANWNQPVILRCSAVYTRV